MDLSGCGRSFGRAERHIRNAEKYLRVSGRHGPDAIGSYFQYFDALHELNNAGLSAKTPKQRERYERDVKRLGYIATRAVDAAMTEAKEIISDARSNILFVDRLRPMTRAEENFEGHANGYNQLLPQVKKSSLETTALILSRAEGLLKDARTIAEAKEDTHLYRVIGEQEERVRGLKQELKEKSK